LNRVMGIDPGDKRIGIAISDETGTIANPFGVIEHISRPENARRMVKIAVAQHVSRIVIGRTLTDEGDVSYQGRKSERLGQAIQELTCIPVIYWEEDFSTNLAVESRLAMGVKKGKRQGHFDAIAATILLQDFLDSSNREAGLAGSKENV
jgi:putative holliday junction resolvase